MSSEALAIGRSSALDCGPDPYSQLDDKRPEQPAKMARPNASSLVEAVSNAAACLLSKDERIEQLELQCRETADLVNRMKVKVGELMRLQERTDALATSETERADRAEAKAAGLDARVLDLENDLESALTDLHRIAEVITGSLMVPGQR